MQQDNTNPMGTPAPTAPANPIGTSVAGPNAVTTPDTSTEPTVPNVGAETPATSAMENPVMSGTEESKPEEQPGMGGTGTTVPPINPTGM